MEKDEILFSKIFLFFSFVIGLPSHMVAFGRLWRRHPSDRHMVFLSTIFAGCLVMSVVIPVTICESFALYDTRHWAVVLVRHVDLAVNVVVSASICHWAISCICRIAKGGRAWCEHFFAYERNYLRATKPSSFCLIWTFGILYSVMDFLISVDYTGLFYVPTKQQDDAGHDSALVKREDWTKIHHTLLLTVNLTTYVIQLVCLILAINGLRSIRTRVDHKQGRRPSLTLETSHQSQISEPVADHQQSTNEVNIMPPVGRDTVRVKGISNPDLVVRCSSTRCDVVDNDSHSRVRYSPLSAEARQFPGSILELPVSGLEMTLSNDKISDITDGDWGLHRQHWQHPNLSGNERNRNKPETTRLQQQQQTGALDLAGRERPLARIDNTRDNVAAFCNRGVASVPATLKLYTGDDAVPSAQDAINESSVALFRRSSHQSFPKRSTNDLPKLGSYKKPNYRRKASGDRKQKTGPNEASLQPCCKSSSLLCDTLNSPDVNQVFWLNKCHEELRCELQTPSTCIEKVNNWILPGVELSTDTVGVDPGQIQDRIPPGNDNLSDSISQTRKLGRQEDVLPHILGELDRAETINALMISRTSIVRSSAITNSAMIHPEGNEITTNLSQLRMHLVIGFIAFSTGILIVPQVVMSFRYLMKVSRYQYHSGLMYRSITVVWYVVHSLAALFM